MVTAPSATRSSVVRRGSSTARPGGIMIIRCDTSSVYALRRADWSGGNSESFDDRAA